MRREPFACLHWTTNNHLPHKHTHKPKRGWFDDGHVNVVARMAVSLHHADKDSICGTLEECDAMRRQKGGKLPIGEVDALVYETKYKGIKMTNIFANIVSDGALAEGFLKTEGKLKLADILCSFSFTDTNEMKKMKNKPSLRFHLFHRHKDHNKVAKL